MFYSVQATESRRRKSSALGFVKREQINLIENK